MKTWSASSPPPAIDVARRTVTKYRKMLDIPSSRRTQGLDRVEAQRVEHAEEGEVLIPSWSVSAAVLSGGFGLVALAAGWSGATRRFG